MGDKTTTVDELKAIVKKFCDDRDWDQYHDPKELSIGVVTEASELLDHFRFRSREEMEKMFADIEKRSAITEEMSDVLYFLLRMAQMYDVDLVSEFKKKMGKNENKYPVEKVKGSNKKYSEY